MNIFIKYTLSIFVLSASLLVQGTEEVAPGYMASTWGCVKSTANVVGSGAYYAGKGVWNAGSALVTGATYIPAPFVTKSNWYMWQADTNCDDKWEKIEDFHEFKAVSKGKRVALLIHGLASNHTYMESLAEIIHHIQLREDSPCNYDFILAYEYNTIPAVYRSGYRFKCEATDLLDGTERVDIFCHSKGGIIARHLAESNHELNVKNIVFLGTPNGGVPLTVLKRFIGCFGDMMYPIAGLVIRNISMLAPLDILSTDHTDKGISRTLSYLNSGVESPHKDRVNYYTVAGSKSEFWGTVGDTVGQGCQEEFEGECDGIVPVTSVHADFLRGKSGAYSNNTHQVTLPLNHEELRGGEINTKEAILVAGTLYFFMNQPEWDGDDEVCCWDAALK